MPSAKDASRQCWDDFVAMVPWVVNSDTIVNFGASHPPGHGEPASAAFAGLFPTLMQVLKQAVVTSIGLNGTGYVLLTWKRSDGSFCSWLSPAPPVSPPTSLYADHQTLLASFGGIVERSNEPTWWILNHNDALTQREASHDSTFIADGAWWESLKLPVELKQFNSIAREANGNTTLCHRTSGEVVLYAPDHAFRHVEVLPGCPDYTFYRFVGARYFKEWVDRISRQWRDWAMLPDAPASQQ